MKRISMMMITTFALGLAACDDPASAEGFWAQECDDDYAGAGETEGEEEEEGEVLPPPPPLKPFPGAPALEEIQVESDFEGETPYLLLTFVSSNDHVGQIEVFGGSAADPVQTVELRHDGELVSRQKTDLGGLADGSSCGAPEVSFELGEFEALQGVHEAGTADLYAAAVVAAGEQEGWHTGATPTDCELGCGIVGGGIGASAAAGAVAKVCPLNSPWCAALGAGAAAAGAVVGAEACSKIFCE